MTTLTFEVNSRQVDRLLLSLDTALSPTAMAGFLGGTIDPYIRQRAQQRFEGEGDDVVGKWEPLAVSTQQIRADLGYGPAHPINKRTGDLEAYILDEPHRLEVSSMGATLVSPGAPPKTDLLRAKVRTAQIGSPGNKGQSPTPPRPVMGMNERDLAFVMSALAFYVERSAAL